MATKLSQPHMDHDLEAPPFTKLPEEVDDGESSVGVASHVGVGAATGTHANLRTAFLRRVYCLLTVQLLVTVAVAAGCALFPPASGLLLAHPAAFTYGSLVPTFGSLIALSFLKNVHPWNLILLSVFTLGESVMLGCLSAVYASMGMADVLLSAAGLTLAIFLCLTSFILVSKRDFSFLGGFLFAGLFVMIGWGLLNLLLGWKLQFLYSAAGALLFTGFVLYDTSVILHKFSYDEYISASVQLYLDIINLFMYILQLLSRRD